VTLDDDSSAFPFRRLVDADGAFFGEAFSAGGSDFLDRFFGDLAGAVSDSFVGSEDSVFDSSLTCFVGDFEPGFLPLFFGVAVVVVVVVVISASELFFSGSETGSCDDFGGRPLRFVGDVVVDVVGVSADLSSAGGTLDRDRFDGETSLMKGSATKSAGKFSIFWYLVNSSAQLTLEQKLDLIVSPTRQVLASWYYKVLSTDFKSDYK